MKKVTPIVFIIVTVIIVIIITLSSGKTVKTIDWSESFNEKSNKPYGVSVLYNELPNLFKDYKVRTVYHEPDTYLRANSDYGNGDHIAKGSFVIIGNSNYLYEETANSLLNFVDQGNTLFISDYYFIDIISDTLNIEVDYIEGKKDSISELSLTYKSNHTIIDKNEGDYYFSSIDNNHKILGHSKINEEYVNFIEIPFGEGTVFLHLQPKIFTNYNLLKDERYKYVEAVLSYLPNSDVYFDSYSKIYTPYYGQAEKQSNLGWFLQQPSFKWAWYLLLILTLLFIIFNAKRRQRIIQILNPVQNTTIAFVKTVSNLYFETKDHKNLIDKKITYFLEKVRTDFNLDTSVLDDEFIRRLSAKSGKKKEQVKKLISFINWANTKKEFSEENLTTINKLIEDFYSK